MPLVTEKLEMKVFLHGTAQSYGKVDYQQRKITLGSYYFSNYSLVKLPDKVKRSKALFAFHFFWVHLYLTKSRRNYSSISHNTSNFLRVKKPLTLAPPVSPDLSYYAGST